MQKRILLACLMVSLPLASAAAIRPVLTLSSGFASANVYSSKDISFGPFQNSYNGSNHYTTESDSGLLVGAEMDFLQNWALQLGVSYFENSPFTESGNVYQFSDPEFNNLTYQYQIKSRRISLETKLSHAFLQAWHPYISASVGEAFNQAFQYTETGVTSFDAPMTQPFGSHSNSAFTYSVGLGIDVNIAEHWRLGAGYRFLDLGGASLGVSGLQSGTRTISNSHIHANELLLQVSFVG